MFHKRNASSATPSVSILNHGSLIALFTQPFSPFFFHECKQDPWIAYGHTLNWFAMLATSSSQSTFPASWSSVWRSPDSGSRPQPIRRVSAFASPACWHSSRNNTRQRSTSRTSMHSMSGWWRTYLLSLLSRSSLLLQSVIGQRGLWSLKESMTWNTQVGAILLTCRRQRTIQSQACLRRVSFSTDCSSPMPRTMLSTCLHELLSRPSILFGSWYIFTCTHRDLVTIANHLTPQTAEMRPK